MNKSIIKALSAVFLWSFTTLSYSITVFQNDNANTLADLLLGGDITRVGPAILIGTETQQGFFNEGVSTVGIESGLVLTTGNVNEIPGPNANGDLPETHSLGQMLDDFNTNLGTQGYADLNALSGESSTFDANVLAFNFMFGDGSQGGDLSFQFVFGSEEYIDYINSPFNDVFGFFIDGMNMALVPGTNDPISINTINDVANSSFYRNNVANTNGIPDLGLDIVLDGLTQVITAYAFGLGAGTHSIRFAVADTSDGFLDAAVFIEQGSFTNKQQHEFTSLQNSEPPSFTMSIPEPSPLLSLFTGLIWLFRRNLFITY